MVFCVGCTVGTSLVVTSCVGDACSDHVGWFRLYKPVVVSHDMVSFIQACSCVDVTFGYNGER